MDNYTVWGGDVDLQAIGPCRLDYNKWTTWKPNLNAVATVLYT